MNSVLSPFGPHRLCLSLLSPSTFDILASNQNRAMAILDGVELVVSVISAGEEKSPERPMPIIKGLVAEAGGCFEMDGNYDGAIIGMVNVPRDAFVDFAAAMKAGREPWLTEYGCDINICSREISSWFCQRRPGLALFVFDLDSTLVSMEGIDEIARMAGVYHQVAAITKASMEGRVDFRESLEARVALLKGLESDSTWALLTQSLPYAKGTEKLVQVLRQHSCITAIISGGLLRIAETVKHHLGIDYCFANRLQELDGKFTGRLEGTIVDPASKRSLMLDLAGKHSIPKERVNAMANLEWPIRETRLYRLWPLVMVQMIS